jgi:SagB-type dehydrogenase family enzyme
MQELITLPAPNLKGTVPLEQVIAARRSHRDFSDESLTLEQIGQLAWSAQGQAQKSRYRSVPSAGATYPLELFLISDMGLFHYILTKHALEKVTDQDLRSALASAAWGQGFIADAPLTLVLAAEFERTTSRYGQRGIRYVYMEAGHAAQNIHLQAEALRLGSVAVGAFNDAAVSKVLGLPNHLKPIYMVTVGLRRK